VLYTLLAKLGAAHRVLAFQSDWVVAVRTFRIEAPDHTGLLTVRRREPRARAIMALVP
jgi:hypothetical protein